MQLSMFDVLEPAPIPEPYVEPVTHDVLTRAYGRDHVLKVREGEREPIEIEVRGTPCVVEFRFGFSTYAIQPPGSLFWSETGFRSWTNGVWQQGEGIVFDGAVDDIIGLIEAYIDLPVKKMGCGGKLVQWWPPYINQWRQNVSFHHGRDRSDYWAQWGPEEHARLWAQFDADQAAAIERMRSEGIDPNDVNPPRWHKGPWPKVAE